jgi:capsular polysaccharide transport system permease protein
VNVIVDPRSVREVLPGRMRPLRRFWCYLGAVGLPTLLVGLYLTFIATPQYQTEFRYSVYNAAATKDNSESALTASLSGNPSVHGDYVINDYIRSRGILADLRKQINLPQMFKGSGFDPVFHYWWDDGTIERLARFWNGWVLDASFDNTQLLGTVSVRAFSPQDSLRIANLMIELSERVVNDLGARSRADAVRVAERLLQEAATRKQRAREALSKFREAKHTYSPSRPADSSEALAATLRQNMATLNAQLASLERSLSPTAPAVISIRSQVEASQRELDRISNVLGSAGLTEAGQNRSLPTELGQYEALQQEANFAATAHEAAFRHLEGVRYDASVQHLYIQMHEKPALAQSAIYPRPIRWTLMTFITLTVLWLIGTLLYYSIREHGG